MNDLEEYIRQSREQGYTDDQIHEMLVTNGWPEEEVAPFFAQAGSSVPSAEQASTEPISEIVPPQQSETVTPPEPIEAQVLPPAGDIPSEESVVADTPSPKPPFQPLLTPQRLIMIAGGIFFFVLLVGVVAALALRGRGIPSTGTPPVAQATPSATLAPTEAAGATDSDTASSAAGLATVVYTRTKTATGSAYLAYTFDLQTRKAREVTKDLFGSREGIIRLCQWSPDGTRLPVLAYDTPKTKAVIWDIISGESKPKEVADITKDPRFGEIATGFGSKCRWVNNTDLLLTSRLDANSPVNEALRLASDGAILEATDSAETDRFRFPNMILARGPEEENSSVTQYSVDINGRTYIISPSEFPIGEATAGFLTMQVEFVGNDEVSATGSAELKAYLNDYQKEATAPGNALSPSELEELQKQGALKIPLYTLITYPASLRQLYPASPFWAFVDAIPHPDGKRVITQEFQLASQVQDTVPIRFFLFDPEAGTKKLIAEQSARYTAGVYTPAKSYLVTPDGKWLVTARYDTKTQIVAYSVETGETVVVCDSNCRAFEVYDPTMPIHEE